MKVGQPHTIMSTAQDGNWWTSAASHGTYRSGTLGKSTVGNSAMKTSKNDVTYDGVLGRSAASQSVACLKTDRRDDFEALRFFICDGRAFHETKMFGIDSKNNIPKTRKGRGERTLLVHHQWLTA